MQTSSFCFYLCFHLLWHNWPPRTNTSQETVGGLLGANRTSSVRTVLSNESTPGIPHHPPMPSYLLHASIASIENGNSQLQRLNHHGTHLTCQGEDLIDSPRKEVVNYTCWAFSRLVNVTLGHGALALCQSPRVYLETGTSPLLALIIWRTISAAPRSCKRACWYSVFCFSISFS